MGQKPRGHPSFWPFETSHNKPNPLLEHRPATWVPSGPAKGPLGTPILSMQTMLKARLAEKL